ncbi:MAG TPA: Fe-S cluster assembly protein SufD, partial [Gemmataceae bacterium]|nr:Fe-S cluster assembly protein SufD [Gemmataceae bacterium]
RVSAWPHALRTAAIERFAEVGFPTSRDEDWKFTSLTPLAEIPFKLASGHELHSFTAEGSSDNALDIAATVRLVFVNGRLAPDLSTPGALPGNVVIGSLAAAMEQHRTLVEPHLTRLARHESHAFTALNTAFLSDGAFIHVGRGVVLREPIELVFLSTAPTEPTVSHPRTLIVAEDNSQLTVVQSYLGTDEVYFTNAVTEIIAGENAYIDHYKLQRESLKAFHLETLQVRQERGSNFSSHAVTLGAGWARNEIGVTLAGEGCESILNGLYLADGTQHVDNRTTIDHAKPHCASHELYKGILDGKAHGVFNGKIYVREDAQKTDAKQTNQTLLLSEDAVINTKPQLEIFADDVKCTHGATIGQLSTDALFYLRARGIGLEDARSLLTYAFANDVLDRMKLETLRRQLEELLLARQSLSTEPGVKEVS